MLHFSLKNDTASSVLNVHLAGNAMPNAFDAFVPSLAHSSQDQKDLPSILWNFMLAGVVAEMATIPF